MKTALIAPSILSGNFAEMGKDVINMKHAEAFIQSFFHNDKVPLWLLLFGSAGQIIFTLRFIYQYWYSSRRGESELPPFFWILSLIGSLSIVTYGIIRHDPVLIVGQSFGLIAYIRNLMIGAKGKAVS